MPGTGKAEKPDSEKKPPRAKARKKAGANKKKAGKARRPAATKVKKARTRPKTNGQTAPATKQTVNPVPGRAISGLFRILTIRPDLIIREQMGLLLELMQVAMGDSQVASDPADRRFRHEVW